MSGTTNWPVPIGMDDWMRNQEKRVMREERRPLIRHASELMGPGLAPFAVELFDWNGENTLFNGFFFSVPGAQNSPDILKYWMGTSFATQEGYGYQYVWEYQGGGAPPDAYIRTFETIPGTLRAFSAWSACGCGGGGGGGTITSVNGDTGPAVVLDAADVGAVESVNGDFGPTVTLTAADVGAPPDTRAVNTDATLTGGGNLTVDRTIGVDTTAEAERIRDVIGTALVAGTNVTIVVSDVGDTITISASGGGGATLDPFLLMGG